MQRQRKGRKSSGDEVLDEQRASPAAVGCTRAAGKMIWLLAWHMGKFSSRIQQQQSCLDLESLMNIYSCPMLCSCSCSLWASFSWYSTADVPGQAKNQPQIPKGQVIAILEFLLVSHRSSLFKLHSQPQCLDDSFSEHFLLICLFLI